MESRSHAEKILKELKFDFATFTVEAFVRYVGESKGREIMLMPWNDKGMPPGMFGAWISDGEQPKEYIFYRSDLSRIHQIHVQLHELSHFLCGHPTLKITQDLLNQITAGKVSPSFGQLPQMRAAYKTHIESEAETLAYLIQEQALQHISFSQLINDLSAEKKFADFVKMMRLT